MYHPRALEKSILEASAHFPVLLITGARQVGKTTLLRHLAAEERHYVTLDDPLLLSLARQDPALFMQRFQGPLLIDEIQCAPQLLPYLKMAADEDKKPGRFWLTGSQQFQMMHNISESLAGRVGILSLLGLSRREALGQGGYRPPFVPEARLWQDSDEAPLTLPDLYKLIWRGSFPALALDKGLNRDLFFSSYVQTYLQRDVRDLAQVGDEMAFLRFLRAAAARSAQQLNIADLSRDADVSPVTGKKWLSVLEASGLIYLLEPYFSNVTKRLVKTPKLYFLDTGLAAYLTEWSSPETLEAGAMSGAFFESWVMAELLKSWLNNGLRPPFYYYRDKDQQEIDLVILQNGQAHPIEFKKSASPGKSDTRHFQALEKLIPVAGGAVICLASQALPLSETVGIVPVGRI